MNDRMEDCDEKKTVSSVSTTARIIWFVLGVLEVLLAMRLIFKLLGANPESAIVSFVYGLSAIFLAPFTAIFPNASTQGATTTAVLEPSTIIGMIVYALIAWGIVKLVVIVSKRKHVSD